MISIMNNNHKIRETPNVSEASSFEDRQIKSGLKTSPPRYNKTMNNDYRTTIMDTPIPHIGVETLRPTPFKGINRMSSNSIDVTTSHVI